MEIDQNIILSQNKNTNKYSSNLIQRGLSLAKKINQLSSNNCNQILQLLENINRNYLMRDYQKVLDDSENLIHIKHNCAEAWLYKSQALWKLYQYEKALTAVEQAILLKTDFVEALLTKSAIFIDLGDWDNNEVLRISEQVIKINSKEYRAWYNQGLVLKNIRKDLEAEFFFNEAIKLKPSYSNIKYAKTWYGLEKIEENKLINNKKINYNYFQHRNWKLIATFNTNYTLNKSEYDFCNQINSILIFSKNIIAVSNSNNAIIQFWSLGTKSFLYSFYSNLKSINSLAITHDEQMLIIAGKSINNKETVELWNLNRGELLYSLFAQLEQTYSIDISHDSKLLISADGTIKLWDLETKKLLNTIENKNTNFWSVAIAPDAQTLACTGVLCPADFDTISIDILMVFNLETGQLIYSHHTPSSEYVIFSPDGQLLAQSVEDEPVHIWNAHTGELIRTLNHPYDYISGLSEIKGLAFNEDGDILASSNCRAQINLWNPKTGEHIQTLSGSSNNKYKRYSNPKSFVKNKN